MTTANLISRKNQTKPQEYVLTSHLSMEIDKLYKCAKPWFKTIVISNSVN